MPNIIAYDRNRSKTALINAPRTDAMLEGRKAGPFIPMLTWADWELLQELHKAREASQLCQDEGCPHSGTAHVCVNDVKPFNPDLFPSYDKQYESLRSSGPDNPSFGCRITHLSLGGDPLAGAGKIGGSASGHVGGDGVKPATMNWQAVAADLQDQIKDWETKCKQMETRNGDIQAALKGALETSNKLATENAELSKSLQHYRNAYFADQGKPYPVDENHDDAE